MSFPACFHKDLIECLEKCYTFLSSNSLRSIEMSPLKQLRIVLVEPAGALNVGSIARIMKNMGLEQLILVNPHCDRLGEEARRMAVHGIEVLENARIVASVPEALSGCQRAIATTARSRNLPTNLETPRNAVVDLLKDNIPSALIFGPEDRGLSNSELSYAQRFIGIPSNPEYPSLNLAQAVAVCAYELYQASLNKNENVVAIEDIYSGDRDIVQPCDRVPLEILEGYFQHLEQTLLKIGYLHPHTATARMEKFRRIYNRASLSSEEVALLRGILRQMDWFTSNSQLEIEEE
jgi:tRNA/rRNA methyltransferase